MSNMGSLRMSLTNAYGEPLGEKIDIFLRHQVLTDNRAAKGVSATAKKRIVIEDLFGAPQGLYRLEIDPPSYRAMRQFVNINASGFTDETIIFLVDPGKVVSVTFPAFDALPADAQSLLNNSTQVFSFEGQSGEALYGALDDIRRAGLLNILAKTAATPLSSGKTVLPFIQELKEIRGDRFFAAVPKQLREDTKNSKAAGLFEEVSSILHHPPDGFSHAGSFKTKDQFGNLQLTFFMKGNDCVADIDIDDASGFEHIFQVLHNLLPGQSTHPFNIHELLVAHQKLDPGYRFVI